MRWALALVAGFLGIAEARADCAGRDLFAELERNEPAVAAELLTKSRAVPNAEGRFWKVSRPDVAPSYVLGTYHVADAVDMISDRVWRELEGARIAIFEVALEEQLALEQRMQSEPGLSITDDFRPFAERFEGRDLELVRKAFTSRGLPPGAAERLRPWIQFSLLAFPPCQIVAAQFAGDMLDTALARRAAGLGIPQIGLEDPLEAVSLIDRMAPEFRDRLMIASARLSAIEEDAFATAMSFYRQGRIGIIVTFNDWLIEREAPGLGMKEANLALYGELLDARNVRWMPRLLEEAGKGGAFVAVGALHLVGETGLIAAFERAGFAVERLAP